MNNMTPAIIDADELVDRYKIKQDIKKGNKTNVEVKAGPSLGVVSSFTLYINVQNKHINYPNVEIKSIHISEDSTHLEVRLLDSRCHICKDICFIKEKSKNYWIIDDEISY